MLLALFLLALLFLSPRQSQSLNPIYLSFILLAEPLTDEGGEETRVPKENPW